MQRSLSESSIVTAYADASAKRITRKVIKFLQQKTEVMSGPDSGLNCFWDEICAQIQSEYSYFWDAYEETVFSLVRGYLTEVPQHEREAIWLQTDNGQDWLFKEAEERDDYPVMDEEIVTYLVNSYVFAEAGRWSNERIRNYIDPPA
jgi:hypothetical protein